MALQRNLIDSRTLESEKGYYPTQSVTAVFAPSVIAITDTDTRVTAAIPGGDTWPILTPLYFDATGGTGGDGAWKIWTNLFAIDGFLIGATGHNTSLMDSGRSGMLQLDTAADVQGVIMLNGEVDYHSIFSPADFLYVHEILAAAGTVDTNLDAALKTNLKSKGIFTTNLHGVR
jgi:hypothetical protein